MQFCTIGYWNQSKCGNNIIYAFKWLELNVCVSRARCKKCNWPWVFILIYVMLLNICYIWSTKQSNIYPKSKKSLFHLLFTWVAHVTNCDWFVLLKIFFKKSPNLVFLPYMREGDQKPNFMTPSIQGLDFGLCVFLWKSS